MRKCSSFTLYLATLTLIASCDMRASDEKPTLDDLVHEARALHDELMTRLADRGVTVAELDAVAQSGDEDALRELFGMDEAELTEAHARLVAIGEAVERLGGVPHSLQARLTRGPCDSEIGACMATAAGGASRFPNKIGLALYIVGTLACGWRLCGPGRRR